MQQRGVTPSLQWLVWGGLCAVALAIVVAYFASDRREEPQFNLPLVGEVTDFALTNQAGAVVQLEDLKGYVWVADIIFTRCPGPCAQLTRQMRVLQRHLDDEPDVRLVSLTADPEFDQPEVLRRYGEEVEAGTDQWMFLTGPKQEVYDLARNGLKFAVEEKEEGEQTVPEDLFIHSTRWVVVDKEGRVRAFVDALEPGGVEQTVAIVHQLLRE